ncbi:hypothetical protein EON67_08185 [archaeon]|nr:MAG: hypothetical protein EON67_08185 [archaeon]
MHTVHGIYGVFHLLKGAYLAVITKSRKVATGPYGCSIYQVDNMNFIPIERNSARKLSDEEQEEETTYVHVHGRPCMRPPACGAHTRGSSLARRRPYLAAGTCACCTTLRTRTPSSFRRSMT